MRTLILIVSLRAFDFKCLSSTSGKRNYCNWCSGKFALFLVKISINFSPSYSTVFFPITVYVSTVQNFKILVQCFNE
jgi:hypothetical protein